MKIFLLLFILTTSNLNAQNVLKFDKRNVQCENKWIAYQMNKDSIYSYGFIYIDYQAGLTLNYEGYFKIDKKGNFKKIESTEKRNVGFMKIRLEPNRVAIAEIPEEKFNDLKIEKEPNWLKIYKGDENSIEKLFRWGYLYNGYGEIEKALTYLEKAEKINPNFKGLQTELAFSYNALGKFNIAEIALQMDLINNPKDCYTLKELAYTYNHLENLDKSIETYNKMASLCTNKSFLQETAYNLAYKYYQIKDKTRFEKWNKETKKWSDNENQYTKNLNQLELELISINTNDK
jgi:tetratricopeptide (TPR) repeat protein